MSKTPNWKIDPDDRDWECDWEGSRRFHLRYFQSFTTEEKLQAIEDMCEFVERFRGTARQGGDQPA